ncbi:bromodomain containing 8 isoform X2 [Rhodnius prolixus]|uniref:bromodomain containing 8 isoform X2 n=1 Tax=Rhodnius prolixus TaxID=13249 RepID=UPI003D18BB4C
MKRIQLEPWTPYDKLSLASAVMRTGDQNWNAVARATRNIFEENTKYMIEEKRSPEWFSNKQCAAQYEALLKNIGPRRKKKSEKSGSDHIGETPTDIIMNAVRQECIEELKRSLASTQALYLKLHKEYEDIQAGKMDHKLEEMLEEYEAKEREKEIKMKLKFKLGEKNPEILENNINSCIQSEDSELKKTVEKESTPVGETAKTNLTTSPLLTSLLQSPSPLTRPNIPSNTSPTISLLLNSSPSVPTSDSPTLTKLLEASSTVIGSPISTTSTATPPAATSRQESTINLINTTASVTTPSTPSQVLSSPVVTPSDVISKEANATISPSLSATAMATLSSSSSTVSNKTARTLTTTSVSAPLISVSNTSLSASVSSTTDHSVASSPSISGDMEQVSGEVVIKEETASSQDKEILEIEEVVNPSTPEVVLEDLVHTVVESEVVIGQETPTSKRRSAARRIQLEQVEETETDDEVMETVEQIIEKVEEAIIETVGKEPAEIDLAHNQSSETDNLSDQIETLDLDSHAVEVIVLGHNQGKVITIRHDTELSGDTPKSDPSVKEVRALETFGEIENIVEEEVRTLVDELQGIEEVVENVEEVVEEVIKIQDEIIEHEEVVEDKILVEEVAEVVEENEVANNVVELEEMKLAGDKADELMKVEIKQEVINKEEVEIRPALPLNSKSEPSAPENELISVEEIKIESQSNKDNNGEIIITEETVELEEIGNDESLDIVETKIEEVGIVEEAPEEVVIAELVEEVVQAEKMQIKSITEEKSFKKTTIAEDLNVPVKEESVEEEETVVEMISIPREPEATPKVPKKEKITLEEAEGVTKSLKEEPKIDLVPSRQDITPASKSEKVGVRSKETKGTLRTPGRSLDKNSSTPIASTETGKSVKNEKNNEKAANVVIRPVQELEKRRTGRKREDDREYKAWKKSIMLVYNRLAAHKYASVFLKPITEIEANGYHNVVLRPMDLTTIKRNIETGVIRSTVEFQRDMILMAQNAMIYNKPDSLIFKMAEDMLADMMSQMEVMVQALGDGVPLWGDSDEKLLTRGRASKSQPDESGTHKRRSIVDETPSRRRQQQQPAEDSGKKRKGQSQEEVSAKKKSEDMRRKAHLDESVKKKSMEESTSKRKSMVEESSTIKKKVQIDESANKKKYFTDEFSYNSSTSGSSSRKKTQSEETTSSSKKKFQTDDNSNSSRKTTTNADETPPTGKRKSQQIEESNKRKTETSSNSKRKSLMDETPKRKSVPLEDTPTGSTKKKGAAHVDETPTNKRKRSSAAVVEEPRSSNKRKRAEAT